MKLKPHIRIIRGLWYCSFPSVRYAFLGLGYTPRAAYDVWSKNAEKPVMRTNLCT